MVAMWFSRSLTRRTLVQVALRITVVVALATVVSYWHIRSHLEAQALEHLTQYVEQRRARESSIFTLARDNLARFTDVYRQRLATLSRQNGRVRFDALFEAREDGTTRLRQEVFDTAGITGVLGKYAEVDDAVKTRLVAAFDLLRDFGPAWGSQFMNLYMVTPEPAILMYWPGEPWALDAQDWEIHGKIALLSGEEGHIMVSGALPEERQRRRGWSDLYFDYGVNQWLISALHTIDVDGQSLAVGHDVLLTELIQRTLTSGLDGTYNLILDQNGRLIAHPRFMEAILAKGGALPLQEAGDAHLQRIYHLARNRGATQVMVPNKADDEFLAVTQLEGPGWYLITVFPEAIVVNEAIETTRWILILGVLALCLEIGMLFVVLRKQVAQPLRRLIEATGQLGSGLWRTELKVEREDELGRLADAFNIMAREIEARETSLNDHNQRLSELNIRLERELAERKRAEQELARQREFHALLNTIDYGVLMLEPDLRVRIYNRAYRKMLGIADAFLQDKPAYRDILEWARSAGLYAVADEAWHRFVADHLNEIGLTKETRREWLRADGRIFEVQCIPFPDGGRMLTYFELTRLKQTEAALVEAKEQAEAASRAKSNFLASMSHELRTPLNAILGYGEMLIEEAEDEGNARWLSDLMRIRYAGQHLLSLINDILDLSKIEAGKMELLVREFALLPFLDESMKTLESIVDTERVALRVEAKPDLPNLTNDPDKLRQVVINLLSNAAKFTQEGSITLRAYEAGSRITIEVADTGIGIPEEAQTLIFEEFRQVHGGSTTASTPGTGLGLAISQRLVHLMGGEIALQSQLGVGSVFSIALPIDV